MKIVSGVMIAVKKNGKFLLLKDEKKNVWQFPSEEFNNNLNGSLDDTIERILKVITHSRQSADYLGSFLKKEKHRILIGYNFSIENFKGSLLAKIHRWATRNELEGIKLDKNTSTFLKLHKDLI